MRRGHKVLFVIRFLILAVVALVVLGLATMLLWNWLVPDLFGGKTIDYAQALGLLVLARLLFGRFRGGGRHLNWRYRMIERWESMTPEERERFRAGFRRRWHQWDPPGSPVAAAPVAGAPPAAAQPVAAQPVAAQPVAAQPVAAQPVAAQPVAAQPVAAQPVAAAPETAPTA